MHQRLLGEYAGIVDQEFGREGIHAINHHVVAADQFQGILCDEAIFIHDHADIGIERLNLFFS